MTIIKTLLQRYYTTTYTFYYTTPLLTPNLLSESYQVVDTPTTYTTPTNLFVITIPLETLY